MSLQFYRADDFTSGKILTMPIQCQYMCVCQLCVGVCVCEG